MAGSDLNVDRLRNWSEMLDRRLRFLPFDWRLLAPFFLAGAAVGVLLLGWFVVFVAGQGGEDLEETE